MKRKNNSTVTEESVQTQSSESVLEQVQTVNSNDTTSNNGENTMTQKFDFNSLVAAEKQLSLDDHAEYQKVLREIARDQCKRPEAEILRLLERCGRDVKDLQADVQWRTNRDSQIAELGREQEYRDKNDELLAILQTMREEFEKAEAEYHEKRYPIIWESDQLDEKLKKIRNYRNELLHDCRDAALEIERETLESSLDDRIAYELDKEQIEIRDEIRQLECRLENLPIMPNRREAKEELSRQIKKLNEEHEHVQRKKDEFAAKKANQKAAIEALRERMIYS